jgi:hypothetical protein
MNRPMHLTQRIKGLAELQKAYAAQSLDYWTNGTKFTTLFDAQQSAIRIGVRNTYGYLEIARQLNNGFIKKWYGYIVYGPEKYGWFERIEHRSTQRI